MSKTRTVTLTAAADEGATEEVVVGAAVAGAEIADHVVIDASLTPNEGGPLDVYIQREIVTDVWRDWVHFAQIAAGAATAVHSTIECGLASESAATVVGVGDATTATPALAAGDIACKAPMGRMRLVLDQGASTTASREQTVRVIFRYDWI